MSKGVFGINPMPRQFLRALTIVQQALFRETSAIIAKYRLPEHMELICSCKESLRSSSKNLIRNLSEVSHNSNNLSPFTNILFFIILATNCNIISIIGEQFRFEPDFGCRH